MADPDSALLRSNRSGAAWFRVLGFRVFRALGFRVF